MERRAGTRPPPPRRLMGAGRLRRMGSQAAACTEVLAPREEDSGGAMAGVIRKRESLWRMLKICWLEAG